MHLEFMARLKRREPRVLRADIHAFIRDGGVISTRMLISVCAFATALGCATMEPTIPAEPGVAFDLPVGQERVLAEESESVASAALLSRSDTGLPVEDLVRSATAAPPGTTAVAAMERFLATADEQRLVRSAG